MAVVVGVLAVRNVVGESLVLPVLYVPVNLVTAALLARNSVDLSGVSSIMLILVLGGTLVGGVITLFSWLARGRLTLDADLGRSFHPLGPLTVEIDAPRELVYEHLSAPYLGRTPRETAATFEVIERGSDMVVARHFSKVAFYTSETVESVRFEAPGRISFRHLRGPVPHAVEAFELVERNGGTELVYTGELGIDFWVLGKLAGRYWVTPTWIGVVHDHLDQVKTAAEVRAEARRRREQRHGTGGPTAGRSRQPPAGDGGGINGAGP